jgi:hypothetical protein
MNKKEIRLQRKLEKQVKRTGKSVRLSQEIEIKDKYIRSSVSPDLTKIARYPSPDNYKKYYFSWCNTHSDKENHWSWGEPRAWSDDEYKNTIKSTLDNSINNSWQEVEAKTYNGSGGFRKILNKYQSLDSICNEAQLRWCDADYISQFEELFRFRVGSGKRIWGIRVQHHFFVVWYERQHKICPIKS